MQTVVDKTAEPVFEALGAAKLPEASGAPINILLVDDDPRNLAALEAALESPDYRLVRAETADDALRAISSHDFALLILDVRMPDVSGLELARIIKDRKKTRHLPIIFLTAYYQEDEYALRGYDAGAVDYIAKPFNTTVLRSKVAVFVELYRTNRALQDEVASRADAEQRLAARTAEVQQLVGQLRAMALELNRAEQRERRRLAKVLHDHMQQLLVSAKMQLTLLQHEPVSPRSVEVIGHIQSAVEEALSVSRTVTVELSPPILDQAGLVAALEWLAGRMKETHQFLVRVRADRNAGPTTEEERFLLFECTRELVFNAVKHSGVSEADVALSITDDRRTKIVVEDKGAGFDRNPPWALEDGQSSYGLFSIQQRLAHLGGELRIESELGKGTRATILAPRLIVELPESAPSELPTQREQPARARDESERIDLLIVDDHTIVRQSLASLLRTEDSIRVVGEAGSRDEAIRQADELIPDVILMDVNLGKDSGIEATRTILAKHPQIKIVGLSMHSEDEVASTMRAAGAVGYVTKGVAIADLVSLIRGL